MSDKLVYEHDVRTAHQKPPPPTNFIGSGVVRLELDGSRFEVRLDDAGALVVRHLEGDQIYVAAQSGNEVRLVPERVASAAGGRKHYAKAERAEQREREVAAVVAKAEGRA